MQSAGNLGQRAWGEKKEATLHSITSMSLSQSPDLNRDLTEAVHSWSPWILTELHQLCERRMINDVIFVFNLDSFSFFFHSDITSTLIHDCRTENRRASDGRFCQIVWVFWHSISSSPYTSFLLIVWVAVQYSSIVAKSKHTQRQCRIVRPEKKAIYKTFTDWTTVNSGCANNSDSWSLWIGNLKNSLFLMQSV